MTVYELLKWLSQRYESLYVNKDDDKWVCVGDTQCLSFDLKQHDIYADRKHYLMKNGEWIIKKIKVGDEVFTIDNMTLIGEIENPYSVIEELFEANYVSVPSAREEKIHHSFTTFPTKRMNIQQLMNNAPRTETRYALEGFVLCAVLSQQIKWSNADRWFWRSERCPKLILWRDWFERKEENK